MDNARSETKATTRGFGELGRLVHDPHGIRRTRVVELLLRGEYLTRAVRQVGSSRPTFWRWCMRDLGTRELVAAARTAASLRRTARRRGGVHAILASGILEELGEEQGENRDGRPGRSRSGFGERGL